MCPQYVCIDRLRWYCGLNGAQTPTCPPPSAGCPLWVEWCTDTDVPPTKRWLPAVAGPERHPQGYSPASSEVYAEKAWSQRMHTIVTLFSAKCQSCYLFVLVIVMCRNGNGTKLQFLHFGPVCICFGHVCICFGHVCICFAIEFQCYCCCSRCALCTVHANGSQG